MIFSRVNVGKFGKNKGLQHFFEQKSAFFVQKRLLY